MLIASNSNLQQGLTTGKYLFGTLETYLMWQWSKGEVFQTDMTMAARTLLADPHTSEWGGELLSLCHIHEESLPKIIPTCGQQVPLRQGVNVTTTIADQPSGALAAIGENPKRLLVNVGTGTFVLHPCGAKFQPKPGFLITPLYTMPDGTTCYCHEGTINGGGSVADRFGKGPTELRNVSPSAFCLPDSAGVGSPHWRPDIPFSLSDTTLTNAQTRSLVLEGILFRIREIIEGLTKTPVQVFLTGGLSRDPFIAKGLASCLQQPIKKIDQAESTLLGAARLAAGLPPWKEMDTEVILPCAEGRYLEGKYQEWRRWMSEL